MSNRATATVLVVGLILSACGGGGGGAPAPQPGGTESYSPFTVPDGGGVYQASTWTYILNDGQPVVAQTEQGTITVNFSQPMTMTYDPVTRNRTSSYPLTVTIEVPGSPIPLPGSGTVTSTERIGVVNGVTIIQRQDLRMTLGVPLLVSSTIDTAIAYDVPLEWFPDREDLATLPVGHLHVPAADARGTVTGNANILVVGQPEQNIPINQQFTSPQRWEIVEKLASYEVRGKTWNDVVVVDLTTAVPDLLDPGAGPPAEEAVRMWFARGIGMIKATGAYTIGEAPIAFELLSTSLE